MRAPLSVPPRCRLTSPHSKTPSLVLMTSPHPEEAAQRPSRRMRYRGTLVPTLRDASLRDAPQGEAVCFHRAVGSALGLHRLPQRFAIAAFDARIACRLFGFAHA